MAISNWLSSKYESAKSSVEGVVHKTADSAREGLQSAQKAAGDLYDRGQAALTSVSQTVTQAGAELRDDSSRLISKAAGAAEDLYDRGKAGLTRVGDALRDDSNTLGKLKYANPLYYQGKATEYAGKGLKWAGQGIHAGVEFLDKHSQNLPEPLKVQAGMTAGALGFAGGLIEGTGSLVDWAGRVQQGDTQTLRDTGHALQKTGEGLAYVDGKLREGSGKAVEMLGDATGSELLQRAGQGYQALGKAEQSLAGEDTKKVLDTVGNTGAHYAMRVGELEGKGVQWVGDQTGSQDLQEAGSRMQSNARALQDQTHTGLVDAIDKAAAERGQEYQRNGSYAVTRDATRVVAEVASLVVAPEAVIGKVGTVAKAGEVVGDVGKVVSATEKVTDAARLAEGVSDAARVGKAAEAVAAPGKAGEVGKAVEAVKGAEGAVDTAKVVDKTGDVAKGAEGTADAAQATEKAGEGAKAAEGAWKTEDLGNGATREVREVADPAGGSPWTEIRQDGAVRRERSVAAQDGGPNWTEIDQNGAVRRERSVAAQDGGPNWTEVDRNGMVRRERSVAAQDGGPNWTEVDQNGMMRRERSVAAQDGGPNWTEVETNGATQRSRTVPAQDGGNPWYEAVGPDNKSYRSRTSAPDPDGKGAWIEVEGDSGKFRQRSYTEGGTTWQETQAGGNRWRYREGGMDGLAREAAGKGTSQLQVAGPSGPISVQVHGGASAEELARLQKALDAMPPAAREHARDIYLSDNLGEILSPTGKRQNGVGGLAGDGRMVLDRTELGTDSRARRILYHESGHNADNAMGRLSGSPPWGNGSSVSKYGARNAAEDFAESHRVVLEDWQRYQSMAPADWARESEAAKKMEIVRRYGGTVPSTAEIEQASNLWTRLVRGVNELRDARNPG